MIKTLVCGDHFFITQLIRSQVNITWVFCSNCGERALDNDNFCTNCGKPIRKKIGEFLDKVGFHEAEINDLEESRSPIHDLINEGLRQTKFGKNSQATDTFSEAYEKDSKKVAQNLYRKGLRLAKCGIYSEALDCFDNAEHLDPSYVEVIYAKACLLSIRGEKDAAVILLEKIMGLMPEYKESVRENQVFDNLRDEPRFQKILT